MNRTVFTFSGVHHLEPLEYQYNLNLYYQFAPFVNMSVLRTDPRDFIDTVVVLSHVYKWIIFPVSPGLI